MKINVLVKDGNKIYPYKGKYDESNHLVEIKKKTGIITREIKRFLVDANHLQILFEKGKPKLFVIVDNRSCKSVPLGDNDPPFDKDLENTLDYLIDKAKWEGRRARQTIKGFTVFTLMFSGYGIIRFIEWILTAILGKH